jgi:integrase
MSALSCPVLTWPRRRGGWRRRRPRGQADPADPTARRPLRERRVSADCRVGGDWVFATRAGTPLAQRNTQRSALYRAADAAGLRANGARLRFHDLRSTLASHLIIDLGRDVVQVSRLMGHASPSTTLNIYAHMFDEARHAADIRARMARSAFAGLLDSEEKKRKVITLPAVASARSRLLSARQRAAIKWST